MSAPIAMTAVTSSSIQAYGYEAGSRTLVLTFKGGRSYRYVDVPQSTVDGIREAKSTGSYVAKHVLGKFAIEKAKSR